MGPSPPTLRSRLLRRLWWPLLAVLLLSAVYDYLQALQRAGDNQDLALERIAIALSSRLEVDADDARDDDLGLHLRRTVEAMQRADRHDRLHFAVMGPDHRLIGGEAAVFALGAADAGAADGTRFADRRLGGADVRVVTWPQASPLGALTVVVAETTQRRQAEARAVLADTVWPNLVLMGLAVLLVHRGVRAAMSPLDQLDSAVAARAPDDLSPLPPLPSQQLPGELVPLVQAINRLMAHLRAAATAQQAFLSNAAHQLRTPLAGLQTQIELAVRDTPPAGQARLGAVSAALHRLARTTHQMLALARAGPQAVGAADFAPLDLQGLLEGAASDWLDTALAAGVDLGFEPAPAWVQGSAWMLHELLGNLIDNAIRHSPPGGQVTVACGPGPAGRAWLRVTDAGPGIAEPHRARVFERFYRAPGAPPGGAGLGLAIVREVALRHHGDVALDDAVPGPGLRVTVHLPAAGGSPA